MLTRIEHQQFLRVIDINEKDIFDIDSVYQNVYNFFSLIDLRREDERDDVFKRIKSFSNLF